MSEGGVASHSVQSKQPGLAVTMYATQHQAKRLGCHISSVAHAAARALRMRGQHAGRYSPTGILTRGDAAAASSFTGTYSAAQSVAHAALQCYFTLRSAPSSDGAACARVSGRGRLPSSSRRSRRPPAVLEHAPQLLLQSYAQARRPCGSLGVAHAQAKQSLQRSRCPSTATPPSPSAAAAFFSAGGAEEKNLASERMNNPLGTSSNPSDTETSAVPGAAAHAGPLRAGESRAPASEAAPGHAAAARDSSGGGEGGPLRLHPQVPSSGVYGIPVPLTGASSPDPDVVPLPPPPFLGGGDARQSVGGGGSSHRHPYGGLHVIGPDDPIFQGTGAGGRVGPGGLPSVPGGLPPGVPPGARYDPVLPPSVFPEGARNDPRRPLGSPPPDHLAPPQGEDELGLLRGPGIGGGLRLGSAGPGSLRVDEERGFGGWPGGPNPWGGGEGGLGGMSGLPMPGMGGGGLGFPGGMGGPFAGGMGGPRGPLGGPGMGPRGLGGGPFGPGGFGGGGFGGGGFI